MDLNELKEKLKTFKEIKLTFHAQERIQDKRRNISYPKIMSLIQTPEGLYKFQEQKARNPNERKFKLWFRLNYLYDMNVYIVLIEEKGLNMLEVISTHKVKRKVQQQIDKHEN